MSHQEFLQRVIAEQADRRRERSIAYRIRDACFRECQAPGRLRLGVQRRRHRPASDRGAGHGLSSSAAGQNLVLVGQSGVGKFLIQAIGQPACVLGYRVRYTTSALCWRT